MQYVGVSMAAARAAATGAGIPLWRFHPGRGEAGVALAVLQRPQRRGARPQQEFMVTPLGAPTLAEAVRASAEVYAAAGRQITRQRVQTVLGQLHTATAGMPPPPALLRALAMLDGRPCTPQPSWPAARLFRLRPVSPSADPVPARP